MNATATPQTSPTRWQRVSRRLVTLFHAYANWLVGISWRRFMLLSFLLLVIAGILQNLPPFNWTISETVTEHPRRVVVHRSGAEADMAKRGVQITIDKSGVRVSPGAADSTASAASAAASAPGSPASAASANGSGIVIQIPPGETSEAVRTAVEEARREIEDAIEEARDEAQSARDEAGEAVAEMRRRVEKTTLGEFLPELAVLWIVASIIIKTAYKGRMQAEVKAAQATETAEAESLKRQVIEARMAAMQAQVEPHFLFNTLASIDHLIETDPPRASKMQKNLISLLRASMPTMREANSSGVRELGRELDVIRPYLEILKVRMEDRLQVVLDVPDGLHSAEFPPMVIQSLVENAIKHGLEPKPEGGTLTVRAEIVHGKLAVTVADTGLGFGKAATAGTGVGLANIRERLKLVYGAKGTLAVRENQPGGTAVTVTVPYVAHTPGAAA